MIVGIDKTEAAIGTLIDTDEPLEPEPVLVPAIVPGQKADPFSAAVGICIEWHHDK